MGDNPTIGIKAVAMKRRIQEQIYEDSKDMTPEEFIAYMYQRIANSQFAGFLDKTDQARPLVDHGEKTK